MLPPLMTQAMRDPPGVWYFVAAARETQKRFLERFGGRTYNSWQGDSQGSLQA
jgi:hypothetical protein